MIEPDIIARRIGAERHPVVIVDGFHPDPDALRDHAIASRFGTAREYYPGIRADLPPDYFTQVLPVLLAVLRGVYGAATRCDLIDASFSIVTRSRDALGLEQRIPHVDAVQLDRFALVHYLSPAGGDGTAFFRHRATGMEQLDESRVQAYYDRLNAELNARGEPGPGYIHASTPLFEQTAMVEARYNRAVIYRSAMLHSGAITPQADLSADPATGRLTVTAFLLAD